jgi:Anti-sigma factor NepR
MALRLALVGMARDLVSADLNAVRTAIGTELRKLYSDVLHGEIPGRMAELIKQLDQQMEANPQSGGRRPIASRLHGRDLSGTS